MGVCVPVHAFQSSILSVCMCVSVCVCVLPKSRNGRRHSSASLNHWHLDQSSGSMQMSYWSVTAWTRPLHFLAYCWSRLTPRWIQDGEKDTSENKELWEEVKLRMKYTHLCSNMSILTQEQGRFLPAESCALVVHSLQVSSCTAEHHGLLGFPGLEIDKTCLVAGKTAMLHILFLSNCCAYLIQPDPNQSHVPEPLFLLHMYSIYST